MANTDVTGALDPEDDERRAGLSDDTMAQSSSDAEDDELDDLEEVEEEVIEEWLEVVAELQTQAIHFQGEGRTHKAIEWLRAEQGALHHVKDLLEMVHETEDLEFGAENEVVARWLVNNLATIRKQIHVLAMRVKQAAAVSEATRHELLEQYREIRAEFGRLERHPERAASLIAKLRHFMIRVQKVAYQVEEIMRVWVPLARVLLPRLLPGAGHIPGIYPSMESPGHGG